MKRKKSLATLDSDSSKNQKGNAAYVALLRALGRRDHSEKELFDKLTQWHSLEDVTNAIVIAKEKGYIRPPEALSLCLADMYHRQGKGHFYIQRQLKLRGLPEQSLDSEVELEKCRNLYLKKFGNQMPTNQKADQKATAKAFRYLTYRGFDSETVKKVLFERR